MSSTKIATRSCEHVKSNGEFCQSPALRGRNYCFFHLNHLGRKLRREKQNLLPQASPLELPPLENAEAVQIALMEEIDAIVHQRIDSKRAGLILYALQTASSNLRGGASFETPAEDGTACVEYDSLEEDYDIAEYAPDLRAKAGADEQGEAALAQAVADYKAVEEQDPFTTYDADGRITTLCLPETDEEWAEHDAWKKKMERRGPMAGPKATGLAAGRQCVLFGVKKPPQPATRGSRAEKRKNASYTPAG